MRPKPVFLGSAPFPAGCRGATLVEVLIAVVVLAIGLLGYAALQSTSLQAVHSAQSRSQATWLAYDIADRLRACKAEQGSGAMVGACSTAETADWQALVADMLPSGTGEVDILASTTASVRDFDGDRDLVYLEILVTVEWNDSRGNITDEDGATDAGSQSDTVTFEFWTEL